MFQELFGYTSDHTLRVFNHDKFHGITWNLLERCHSNVGRSYANNPTNIEETAADYVKRKKDQFEEIGKFCSDPNVHFAFLQEADFVGFTNQLSYNDAELTSLSEMYALFCQTLTERGWDFIFDPHTEKVLAYSLKNVKMVAGSEKRLLPYGSKTTEGLEKFALLCATFDFYDTTGAAPYRCILGTYHLQYSKDYSKSFSNTKIELLKSDGGVEMVVLGGDANRPPNRDIGSFMVSSVDDCTNFYTNYAKFDKPNQYTLVELVDDRNGAVKAYDGFSCLAREGSHTVSVYGAHRWIKKKIENDKEIPVLINSSSLTRYTVPTN